MPQTTVVVAAASRRRVRRRLRPGARTAWRRRGDRPRTWSLGAARRPRDARLLGGTVEPVARAAPRRCAAVVVVLLRHAPRHDRAGAASAVAAQRPLSPAP